MSNITSLARPEVLAMKPYESARGSAAADGILLNANEAPQSLLQGPGTDPLSLNRYPAPQPAELKERLAGLYGVDGHRVLVTRGSDEGIDLLLRVFCRAGQDAIIECPPCFGMYRVAANIQGAAVIQVPRDRQAGLRIDFERLCETIRERSDARLVFLTSPNNPTGEVIDNHQLLGVLRACGKHAVLVLDEAYIEFCNARSATALLDEWPNLVVLRTLSKAWGGAGLRCGALIADPEIISLLKRVMAPYPLSAPAIDAAMTVTTTGARSAQRNMLSEIGRSKRALLEFLAGLDWVLETWPGEANFVLIKVADAPALVEYCAGKGIRIRDFSKQDLLDGCVRITVGSAAEMSALRDALEAFGDSQ